MGAEERAEAADGPRAGAEGGRGAGRGEMYALGPGGRPARGTADSGVLALSYTPRLSRASLMPIVDTLATDFQEPPRCKPGCPGGGTGARLPLDAGSPGGGTGGGSPRGGRGRGGNGRGRGGRGRFREPATWSSSSAMRWRSVKWSIRRWKGLSYLRIRYQHPRSECYHLSCVATCRRSSLRARCCS